MVEHARITAAICTRDRGEAIRLPLQAVFGGTLQDFKVLVIDQSSDEQTSAAITEWLSDPRFRYIRTPTRGLSRARNIALAENESPVLAFTDDDCEPSANWLQSFFDALQSSERPAMAFSPVSSPVTCGSDSRARGLAPEWRPTAEHRRRSAWRQPCVGGIGASMALTARAIKRVGGFEPLLGRGSPTVGGEECDFAFRLVANGGEVLELTTGGVTHHGFVPEGGLREALRADLTSVGRALGLRARQGRLAAFAQLYHVVGRTGPRATVRNLLRTGWPHGLNRQCWVIRGFAEGLLSGLPHTMSK